MSNLKKMNFILPGMMAFGRINCEEFPLDSSSIDEYLASGRKYEKIEIQPLIVQTAGEAPFDQAYSK